MSLITSGFIKTSGPSTFILPPPPPNISVWDGTSVGQRWEDLWSKPDREVGDLVIFPSRSLWRYSELSHPGIVGTQGIWLPFLSSVSNPVVRAWSGPDCDGLEYLQDRGFASIMQTDTGGTSAVDYAGEGFEFSAQGTTGLGARIELNALGSWVADAQNIICIADYENTVPGTNGNDRVVISGVVRDRHWSVMSIGTAPSSQVRTGTQDYAINSSVAATNSLQPNPLRADCVLEYKGNSINTLCCDLLRRPLFANVLLNDQFVDSSAETPRAYVGVNKVAAGVGARSRACRWRRLYFITY